MVRTLSRERPQCVREVERRADPAVLEQPIFRKLRVVCVHGDGELADLRRLLVQCFELLVCEYITALLGMDACVVQDLV